MGRMGMEASSRVGWTRDLSASDQKRLGVRVKFWKRMKEK